MSVFLRNNLTVKQRSQISEKDAARKFGGRVQIASGALRHAKGDVLTDRYLIEDKTTNAASYSLKKGRFEKARIEAFNRGKRAMMRITIQGETLCVVTEQEMLEILCRLNP